MTRLDWPVYVIFVCGCLFLLLALLYPSLSALFGTGPARPEQRVLSAVLGLVLLGLWGIWRLAGNS